MENTEQEREANQWAFEAFCDAHPHYAYAQWPEEFWEYFHRKVPNVSREQMIQTLKETEECDAPKTAPK